MIQNVLKNLQICPLELKAQSSKLKAFSFGFLLILLLVPQRGHAFGYEDLIGGFCDRTAEMVTPDETGGDGSEPDRSIYFSQYCNLKEDMEDAVLERVSQQLSLPSFFGAPVKTGLLKKVIRGEDIDSKQLPEPVRKQYFDNTQTLLSDQSTFYRLVTDLYDQEKVYQWMQDGLKAEFKATEVWANGSLGDSPFDLVHDLNLIEVVLFGRKAKVLAPNAVYQWPKNETKTVSAIRPGIPPPPAGAVPATPATVPETTENGSGDAGESGDTPGTALPKNCVAMTEAEKLIALTKNKETETDFKAEREVQESNLDLMCKDPKGLVFKPYQPRGSSPGRPVPTPTEGGPGSPGDDNSPPGADDCPPGARPRDPRRDTPPRIPTGTGTSLTTSRPVFQPFLGGVLQPLPPSNRPACPPPGVEIEVQYFNPVQAIKNEDLTELLPRSEKVCIPWDMCADYNDVRTFLKNFLIDRGMSTENATLAAEPIEASFCATVETFNRPESSYPTEETCVACHVEHMANTLDNILSKNVTPLINPMISFGSSSRFGPPVHFNVTMFTKDISRITGSLFGNKPTTATEVIKEMTKIEQEAEHKLDPNEKRPVIAARSISPSQSLSDVTGDISTLEAKQNQQYLEGLKALRIAGENQGPAEYWQTVQQGLNYWQQSFQRINYSLFDIRLGLDFTQKNQCEK